MRPFKPATRAVAFPSRTPAGRRSDLDQAREEWASSAAEILDRDPNGHEPLKPACRVVDLIVTWDQVAEGDLVVDRGLLVSVAATEDDTSQPACIRLKLSPSRDPERDRWVTRRRDHWTAVRRYAESSED